MKRKQTSQLFCVPPVWLWRSQGSGYGFQLQGPHPRPELSRDSLDFYSLQSQCVKLTVVATQHPEVRPVRRACLWSVQGQNSVLPDFAPAVPTAGTTLPSDLCLTLRVSAESHPLRQSFLLLDSKPAHPSPVFLTSTVVDSASWVCTVSLQNLIPEVEAGLDCPLWFLPSPEWSLSYGRLFWFYLAA
jgi:hypothetical protein